MKLKGLKKAAGELKSAQYANIYVDVESGEIIVMTYVGQGGCSYVDHQTIKYVCEYNYRYCPSTMKWIKEQVEEFLYLRQLELTKAE